MKSRNKYYVFLTVAIVLGMALFLSSKFWLPDDRAVQNDNYNQLIFVGAWNLSLSDATFDKSASALTCTLYQKAQQDNPGTYSIRAYKGNSDLNKALPVKVIRQKNNPDYAVLKISHVPADYYYVTVVFTSSSGSESYTQSVRIDYRNADVKTSSSSSQGG
jgi:hypothetical protein